jgi:aminodeoxyfutalosine deaminase
VSLARFLQRMPKVELHVHLEGSMRPRVLLELARRNQVELPARDEDGLRQWFRFRDFEHFVQVYLTCSRVLRRPEDFQLLALDFLEMQAGQSVAYCEVHFTISTHLANGGNGGEILAALAEAIGEGERRFGVRLRLIADIVRNVGVPAADRTLEWALAGRGHGVVALGLSGKEAGFPNEPYREHFAVARREGLHCVAHAGEHAGPESIRSVLEVCGAERIGHGVRAVEDPALVEELRVRGIPLEVCPSSNIALGVFPDLASHSFDRLYRSGVPVSVNSDDGPLFNTDLSREYLLLHQTFGYTPAELAGLALAGLRQSFLPRDEKTTLEAGFRKRMTALARELLDAHLDFSVG